MLYTPQCYVRQCVHFQGVETLTEGEEISQVPVCPAFPGGIPDAIAYGHDKHLTRHPDQVTYVVYEKRTEP